MEIVRRGVGHLLSLFHSQFFMSKSYVMYCRASGSPSQQYGLSAQQECLERYANKNGFNVIQRYSDISSSKGRRPAFGKMLQSLMKQKDIGILVTDVSRLARDVPTMVALDNLMESGCIRCITTPQETYSNAESDRLFLNVVALLGAHETVERSKAIRRGIEAKKMRTRK